MPDYGCSPLWEPTSKGYNVNPAELPISDALRARLWDWARWYDATLNQAYPPASGFPNGQHEVEFLAEGAEIAKQLRQELGTGYVVLGPTFSEVQ